MRRPRGVEGGYSLVELIVVIVIIGILVAVAVPVLLGQRKSAHDAAIKSDLHNVATAVAAAALRSDGVVVKGDVASELRLSPSVVVTVAREGEGFCAIGASSRSDRTWVIDAQGLAEHAAGQCAGAPLFSLP